MRRVIALSLALVGAASVLRGPNAPTSSPAQPVAARIKVDVDRTIGTVDPLLFGSFTEHLGRMIYGGIY